MRVAGRKASLPHQHQRQFCLLLIMVFRQGRKFDVDIEVIDDGQKMAYRFCGLDESKDRTLSEEEVNVRVSQLKKEYLEGN